MTEFLSIGAAAFMLGVAISTLRRWEKENQLVADYRTPGGHRRYALGKLLGLSGQKPSPIKTVSSREALSMAGP
jgi:hypothetical protein